MMVKTHLDPNTEIHQTHLKEVIGTDQIKHIIIQIYFVLEVHNT